MTKALATKKDSPWSQEQVALITRTVAKGATPDELKLFLYTASRTGLDPLTKQIHFVKRAGQMTVQTGIDGYRAIAERSGTLAGIDDAEYDTESDLHPGKASVTVYRMIAGTRVSYTASARWSEYAPTGNQAFMWNKMPYLMLAKCAEALALRKAFPNDLSGLYTNEEMSQADNGTVVVDATPVKPVEPQDDFVEEVNGLMDETPVEYQPVAQDGEVVDSVPQNSDPKKQCPFCKKWHQGRYAKCLDCWKAERNGQKPQVTKTIINEDAPPFES